MKNRKTGFTIKLQKAIRTLLRVSYIVCILGVVLLGVYSSLGRYYIPKVEQNQEYLIKKIQELSNEPIHIQGLSGSWSVLTPTIKLKGVSFSRQFGSFSTKHLAVEVDFFRSLLKQKIIFKNLHFNDTKIEIKNSEDLIGKNDNDTSFSFVPSEFIKLIEGFSSASIDNASVRLWFKDGSYTDINNIAMVVQKKTGSQLVTIAANFANSGAVQGQLKLNNMFNRSANKASGWLKINGGELSVFQPLTEQLGLGVLPDSTEGEFWFDWRKKYHFNAQGNLKIPSLALPEISKEKLENITDIRSQFYFSSLKGNRPELWIKKANFKWYGAEKAFNQFYIQLNALSSPNEFSVYFPSFSIDYVTQLASELPLPEKLKNSITDLSPQGYLKQLHIDVDMLNKNDPVTIKANLENVSVAPWEGAPGAKGVNGYIEAHKTTGFVEVDANRLSLSFPKLYKEPLFFDKAKTRVHWRITDKRVSVVSDLIRAQGSFGDAQGHLALDIPIVKDSYEPTMYLAVGFNDIDARYRMQFIPTIIDEGLYDWLEKSIKGGQTNAGGFVYRGSIEPGHTGYQTFQFFADIENADLDYYSPWPEVSNVSGQLVVDNSSVQINVVEGEVYDSQINKSVIEVTKDNNIVALTGLGSGDFLSFDVIRLLQESPITEMTNNAFNNWYAKGRTKADFSLYIPLSEKVDPEVYVDAQIEKTQLILPVNNLSIDDIEGSVVYDTRRGLSGENIQGRLFGHKIDVDIITDEKYGRKTQDIKFFGAASVESLKRWLDQPILDFMSGDTTFSGNVTVDNAVNIHTFLDLQGVTINLPEPLGKAEDDVWNVNANAFVKNGNVFFKLEDEEMFSLTLNWNNGDLSQGDIFFGDSISNHAKVQNSQAITLTGLLTEARLDDWLPLISSYSEFYRKPKVSLNDATAIKTNEPAIGFAIKNLKINKAEAFSFKAKDIDVSVSDVDTAWKVTLDSSAVKGAISLMKDDTLATEIDLSYLSLQLPFLKMKQLPNSNVIQQTESTAAESHSTTLPFVDIQQNQSVASNFSEKLNIQVKKLMLNGIDAGEWMMSVTPDSTAVRVNGIKANSRYITISGVEGSGATLTWPKDTDNAKSAFEGIIQNKSLKKFLTKWGYDVPLHAKHGDFAIDINWPGDIKDFALSSINGTVSLKVVDGGFSQLNSSGTNFLKTIGVLNVSELLRRLKLDFSDVTDEGFSFDEVTGVLLFHQGKLSMLRPLYVLSPSSELRFTGDVDLLKNKLDMSVVATLPVNSNLPWIAALAGGLPAAAGVFVVSKVMEKQVNQLSSAVYNISGTWDDPEVTFSRLFDAGKDKK